MRWLAWLACVVYSTIPAFWLMVHPLAGFWRARRGNPYVFLVPLWVGMWVVVALVTAPWRGLRLYSLPWAWLPAVGLLGLGIWTYRLAGAGFSWSQLGGLPEVRGVGSQKLAVSGIRARVRHPIYLAHLLEMMAWSLGSGLVVCFGLVAWAVVSGVVMVWMEDLELERRFGKDYRRYRERVPAIFPFRGRYDLH